MQGLFRSLGPVSGLVVSLFSLGLLGAEPIQAVAQPSPWSGGLLTKPQGRIMANNYYPIAIVDNTLSLEGPLWRLTSYLSETGETLPAAAYSTQSPSIQFIDGQMSGNATCNRFFGAYDLDGDRLTIQPGGSTLMACPPAYMAQEQGFMVALGQVNGYEIMAGKLHLLDADGNPLLTFDELVSPDLIGTRWELIAYNNGRGGVVSTLVDSRIALTLEAEGRLAGSAGCNNYVASYTLVDDALTIDPPASTRKLCARPEGVMAQEAAYLGALVTATTYGIADNVLTLKTAAGATVAQFRASDEETF